MCRLKGRTLVRVNGTDISLNGVCTLKAFLEREGYVAGRVAVEKNGAIVPKARFGEETVGDDDRLEIVTFVGGG